MHTRSPVDRLCVALDVSTRAEAVSSVRRLRGSVGVFKIGLELFASEGPSLVDELCRDGVQIFLDLKLHDIPNTVAGAARALTRLGTTMFNVHAFGGTPMMAAAVQAAVEESARAGRKRPLVLAVTILTSIDASLYARELLGSASVEQMTVHLAELARSSGIDGVVASAREVSSIKQACGQDFLVVTPGIRPAGADVADQRRVTTPSEAIRSGSDILVVGRPILAATDPQAAAAAIVKEIAEVGS